MSRDQRRRTHRRGGTALVRQSRLRHVNRVFYVVCEGEATEYEYLTMLNNEYGDRGFRLDFAPRRHGLNPRDVVDQALAAAEDRQVEAVWAVFDRDEHPRIPEAFRDVKGNDKVHIAFSHPSFDPWLLLHFKLYEPQAHGSSEDIHGKLQSCPQFAGFGRRNKHITVERAGELAGRISTAVKNARALVDRCPTPGCSARTGHTMSCPPLVRDPSTDMYLMIESLGIVTPPQ